MNISRLACLMASLSAFAWAVPATSVMTPVRFEENRGQFGPRDVKFVGRQGPLAVAVRSRDVRFTLAQGGSAAQVTMSLRDGQAPKFVEGQGRRADVSHYYLSRTETYRDIPHYDQVRMAQVYPGIDLVFHGAQEALEYDFVVAPNADPRRIRMAFQGASAMLKDGELRFAGASGELRMKRPVAYQHVAGRRREVEASFRLAGNEATFHLGGYDRTQPLIIDPTVIFSTYLGGAAGASGWDAIALLSSPDRLACLEQNGQFVLSRFGAVRTDLVMGRPGANSGCNKLAQRATSNSIDGSRYVVAAGFTHDLTFPLTSGSGSTSRDAVAVVVDLTTMTPLFVERFGGSDQEFVQDIEIGESTFSNDLGSFYLAGATRSNDLPHTAGGFQAANQGGQDGYVFKARIFPGTGFTNRQATYVGGNSDDSLLAMDVPFLESSFPQVCVAGGTSSTNLPISAGALQTTYQGGVDGWITCINNSLASGLVYGTYFGSSGLDFIQDLEHFGSSLAIIGTTDSTSGLPLTAAGTPLNGFLAAINGIGGSATLAYSGYFDSPREFESATPATRGITGVITASGLTQVDLSTSTPTATVSFPFLPAGSLPTSIHADPEGSAGTWIMAGTIYADALPLATPGGPIDAIFSGFSEGFVTEICTSCTAVQGNISLQVGSGGNVSTNSLTCGPAATCPLTVNVNSVINLVAAPQSGFITNWSSASCLNPQPSNTCSVRHPGGGTVNVTANFSAISNLTVQLTGTGTGSVTSSPAGINCPGTCNATLAGPVTLQAAAGSGYVFAGFLGCPGALAGTTCQIPAGFNGMVQTRFNLTPAQPVLSVARVGTLTGPLSNRVWPIRISNAGATAANVQLLGISGPTGTTFPFCSPNILSPMIGPTPIPLGSIAPGASITFNLALDFSACPSTRFNVTFNIGADGGYTISPTLQNLTR